MFEMFERIFPNVPDEARAGLALQLSCWTSSSNSSHNSNSFCT
jgi:hypothetical protein